MGKKGKKNRIDVVYSTNPDFDYDHDDFEEEETLAPSQQMLQIHIDRKSRGGKEVTLITDFVGSNDDLKDLGKELKSKIGVGGSSKNGEIIIQGNHREKICQLLDKMGYRYKKVGG